MNDFEKEQKRLGLVSTGKQSQIILELLGDKIKVASQKQVDALKAACRAGKIEQSTLLSHVAALTCLDDLYAELVRDVKTGNSASKDLHEFKRNNEHSQQYPIA